MLKIENFEEFNVHGALRGMRNPLNSWGKSSADADLDLAKRLYKAGTEHLNHVGSKGVLQDVIDCINLHRQVYVDTKAKENWYTMIQLLPSSFNQKRTVTMNLENAVNIINQRSYHKLDEWHTLCDFLKENTFLKKSNLIILAVLQSHYRHMSVLEVFTNREVKSIIDTDIYNRIKTKWIQKIYLYLLSQVCAVE